MLQKIFPTSFRATDFTGLIIALLIFIIAPTVLGWIYSLLKGVFLIGWVLGVIAGLAGLYCFIGIIVALLVFFKVVK